jgi:hypothetical protein
LNCGASERVSFYDRLIENAIVDWAAAPTIFGSHIGGQNRCGNTVKIFDNQKQD